MPAYVPLHVHSEYSLSDSILRLDELGKFARDQGLEAIALSDRNTLYGALKFYRKMRALGIKPVLGCDLSVRDKQGKISQLLLFAQNADGFRHLCELLSFAYTHDQNNGEIATNIDRFTRARCDGILALSGGLEGSIAKAIANGDFTLAQAEAESWHDKFPGRFYLQVSRCGKSDEEALIAACAQIGAALHLPTVATNMACFLRADDYQVHEVRVCISNGYVMDDSKRPRSYTPKQHLRSVADMEATFADAGILLENTAIVAQRCNLVLDLNRYHLPDFPVPEHVDIKNYLIEKARTGLEIRIEALYPDPALRDQKMAEYRQRLEDELTVINQMGFPGYFLIVADFIQWAKDNEVPVGPGRGSGAGSLVAFALQITDLDPLAYDLLFERFLNPERVSMPDFDIDFCMEKRDRVIQYVAAKYGNDRVAQIATHGTMAAKAVVRDVGRVLGMPYPVVDRISRMVPTALGVTLPDALGRSDKAKEKAEFFSADLLEHYEQDEETRHLLDIALQLEGLARNVGRHAGGVVIAPTRLTDFSALYCEQAGGALVAQFDKDDIEAAGLVKFDFLGLRTLTVIDWTVANINRRRQREGKAADFRISRIALDDPETFRLLKSCRTTAIFQLESVGMKNLIRKLQPDTFEDIIALVALFRPGPLQSGMVDDFINRKHGRAAVQYPHPTLEPILKTTYGVIVYQEQVMQAAQVLANYSLGEADLLRRAMGKKKAEVMVEQRAIFVQRAVAGGVAENVATAIFELIAKFAEYGFNKSHSAAYALLSYQTAWLKTHYPAEFMAAVLTSDMDRTEKVVQHIEECATLGVTIHPPSINDSDYAFSVAESGGVIFGLGAIKGVGQGVIEVITAERDANGAFLSLLDLCRRMDLKALKRKTLEILICAGAFDVIDANRGGLFEALPQALKLAEQYQQNQKNNQADMFGLFGEDSSMQTLQVAPGDAWETGKQLGFEKQALGLYLSDHPVNAVARELRAICATSLAELEVKISGWAQPKRRNETHSIILGGLIAEVRRVVSKKGAPMAFVLLDDCSGRVEVSVFGERLEHYREQLCIDQVVVVKAKAEYAFYQQQWRLTAEELLPFDQARYMFAKAMKITTTMERFDAQAIADIQLMRLQQDETAGVVIDLSLSSPSAAVAGRLRLDRRYRLDPEALERIKTRFGEDSVTLVY